MNGAAGWLDVSRPISAETPVWPGDPPWRFALAASIARGDPTNVGAVSGTTHAGTHADAPFHVLEGGASIDALPLDAFVGAADLVAVAGSAGAIEIAEIASALPDTPAPRLLLATGRSDADEFHAFRGLSPAAAAWCVERGLRLVGTDAPSVDPPDSEGLEAHHALLGAGLAVLESLSLAGVDPGRYELVALPLRWTGADASPVRAALRRIEP